MIAGQTAETTSECVGFHHDRDIATTQSTGTEQTTNSHPGSPIYCDHHAHEIRNAISDFSDLYFALHDDALHATPTTLGRVSGTRTPPSPSPRIDDADHLVRWLCDWEDTLRNVLGDPGAPHVTSARPPALTEAQHWLLTRLPRILKLDTWAAELGTDVLTTHTRYTRRVSQDRLIHRLDAPCPSCDTRALHRDDGSSVIVCGFCHRTWTEVEYQRLVIVLASELTR